MPSLILPRYGTQLDNYNKELHALLLKVPEGQNRDLIRYLSCIIMPNKKYKYDINDEFLELFVEHYIDELSLITGQSYMFTYGWFRNTLCKEFKVVNKRDAFADVLSYLKEIASNYIVD